MSPPVSRHSAPQRRFRRALWHWLVVPAIGLAVMFGWWWLQPSAPQALTKAQWVDEQQCQDCHAEVVKAWRGSHHQLAMQPATEHGVLGDFAASPLVSDAERSSFRRAAGEFWLNSTGADGQPADFKVAYTLGLEPLQQYLLALPDGSLQAHAAAWDVKKQHWFHLYPGQGVDHRHPLHWSGSQQNGNAMCIECHTTGFQRGFDAGQQRFASRWQALGVGCQSCHGPASQHLQWARGEVAEAPANLGFTLDLHSAGNQAEVQTCATCHSRRSQLGGDPQPGMPLYDAYQPAGLSAELYEVDGKIKDEVFEYGSFVQSRMHAAGVRCSDCHEPHSATLRLSGNAVCTQCHNPQARARRSAIQGGGLQGKDYESPAHHRHTPGSAGAQCSSCHMPGKWYMQVDYRHDHSFSVPNPEQAQALGHSDACLGCHAGEPPEKIIRAWHDWYGQPAPRDGGYARALAQARAARPGAAAVLLEQLARRDLPGLRKAALLAELPRYPSDAALSAALQGLQHPDPAVRLAAIESLSGLAAPQQLAPALRPLLNDARRAVRLAATWQLLQLPAELRPGDAAWQGAVAAYEASQKAQLDRAEALVNLASLYLLSNRPAEVEPLLRQALQRDRHFHPARLLLAQHLEQSGQGAAAQELLQAAIRDYPGEASLQHALGLLLVRQAQPDQALAALEQAVRLQPANPEYAYVLAVAWHDRGRAAEAIELLRRQLQAQPDNRALRMTLVGYLRAQGRADEVEVLREELRGLNPADPLLR